MATLQGKAVKNTYRQVLQIGANNVGVSGTLQPVQDGAGVNTALSLSTLAATVNGDLTITGDLIITGGGLQIKDLIDDTVAALIQNGTGITWTYNDGAATLTGNFTGTTSVVPEGSNLYYTQGRFDSAFAAKSTTNLAEGTNLYFTEARGNANFATNLAASDTDDLDEGVTNLYFSNSRARLALSVTAGTGISYNNTTGVFNLAAIPNASLTNSSITINSQSVALGASVTLTTTNIAEGTNLYWTNARFDSRFGTKTTTDLAEGTNLYYTQARFDTAFAAKTTTDLAEGTNLYYTDARARLALSSSATGLSYANNSGIFSLTAGYAIPTNVKLGQYDIAYNRSIVSAAVTGTSTKTLSLTQQDANVITATWTDQGITTINGTANQIAATTVGNTTTIGFTNDVTMPNNLVVSGNLTINGTATYVNTESISSKDPLFEVANTNNTTDAVDIGYYGRYYDSVQERVEFTGLFRDASDAGKFKIFTGLVDEPTNVVNTTGTGYTVATLVANVDGNLAGTANAANILSTARTIAATGDAAWSVSFDGSANATAALTLANTGVTATTYGTTTAVPTIAVDSKGRITSASNTNIAFPVTTVNGQAGTVVLTTSNIAEGSNQYFTSARAQAAITGTAPISVASGVVSITQSSAINNGFLSSTDWNTFNNKLSTATAATTYVPYTGATGNVNIGTFSLTAGTGSFTSSGGDGTFAINHTSGSGVALTITKGGNGEGLVINKTSGSGNALSVTGSTSLGALTGTSAAFTSTVVIGSGTSNKSLTIYGGTGVGIEIFETTTGTSKRLNILQEATSVIYNATFGSGTNQHVFQVGGATILTIDGTNSTFTNNLIAASLRTKGDLLLEASNSINRWSLYTFTDNSLRFNYNGVGNDEFYLGSDGIASFSSFLYASTLVASGTSVTSGANITLINNTGSSVSRFYSFGANSSTRGGFRFIGIHSDQGNATNFLEISSSGNLGVANDVPNTSYNAGSWFTNSGLVVGNISGVSGIQINSSSTSTLSAIRFGDGDGVNNLYDQGFIIYNHNVDRMSLGAARGSVMHLVNGAVGILTSSTQAGYALTIAGNVNLPNGTNREIYMGSGSNYNYRIKTDGDDFVINEAGSTDRLRYSYSNTRWFITGGLSVSGSLAKGSGSFKIDHPLESMTETHHLVHSFVESPQANNIYRGKVQLVEGKAKVNLDEVSTMTNGTFAALNRDIHTYTSNESDWDAVRGSVNGNILTIECQNAKSNATVSWLVIGERQDKHMMETEWTDDNGKVIVEPLKVIETNNPIEEETE
jgi:hypothetical protein